MKRVAALLTAAGALVAGLTACADRAPPTAVEPHEAPPAIGPQAAPSALVALDDLLGRVLGGLPESTAKDALQATLEELGAALEADNGCAIRSGWSAAEQALERLDRAAKPEYGAELAVLRLTLESVAPTSNGRCER